VDNDERTEHLHDGRGGGVLGTEDEPDQRVGAAREADGGRYVEQQHVRQRLLVEPCGTFDPFQGFLLAERRREGEAERRRRNGDDLGDLSCHGVEPDGCRA
jgi:hypothetical protein